MTDTRLFSQETSGPHLPTRPHSPGVILIRFPTSMRTTMAKTTLAAVEAHGDKIAISFLVIQPGHIRLQQLP